jgi:hypothetical protein
MATATRALEAPAIEQKKTTKTLRKAGRDASSGLSWLLQPAKTTTTKKNHQVSSNLYIRK